ncbi:magnesium transporter [Velocimicrobium porci]|uniref:Magnesium transporter MgtE n=1 Tax=Velocimicrobium porci TaxID=2606634 RepID=A0A6L5XXK4_9FIRM|nr:magnesium transporter [Velocimicrobium porci]MSS63492.1 magnesium transporter [Velocimicrobium porci]
MTKKIIEKLLAEKKYAQIKDILSALNEVDLAALLEELDEKDMVKIFRLINKQEAALTFSYMNSKMQETLIKAFTEKELKEIIDDMFLDDAVDFLEEMPANVVEHILSITDKETRSQINTLLAYPKDSAGSIMTVEYVDFKKEMTVGEAIHKIKSIGVEKETVYTCYVIEQKKLIGIVSAKDLLTSSDDSLIESIMETNIIYANTFDDQEDVAKLFQKYGFMAIPVVDTEHCMVGIITYDDAINVLQDEVDEDISIMSGMTPNEDSYFGTSVFDHAKHRILWLLVLMLSATITGTIITRYEDAFSAIPILVSFIPMLMDTGGNCGSQSSTLIIRGLAVDEIKLNQVFKVMFKELRVALVVSIVLSIVNGLRILIMYKNPMLALLISLSLVCTVIMAKLVGCLLPMLATKCKMDPAIMSTPLITTLVDTGSILIYFQIATHLFHLS